jgi:hypothetical protein
MIGEILSGETAPADTRTVIARNPAPSPAISAVDDIFLVDKLSPGRGERAQCKALQPSASGMLLTPCYRAREFPHTPGQCPQRESFYCTLEPGLLVAEKGLSLHRN